MKRPVHVQHPVGAPCRKVSGGADPDGGHPAAQSGCDGEEFGGHPFAVGFDQHDDFVAVR